MIILRAVGINATRCTTQETDSLYKHQLLMGLTMLSDISAQKPPSSFFKNLRIGAINLIKFRSKLNSRENQTEQQ